MSTLLPPSLVNTMSSDDDKCSNAKRLATWHTIALTSDALTVVIMGTLQQIAPTKSHLQAHHQDAGTPTLVGMIDQHLRVITTPGITTMTIGIGTGSVDLDLARIFSAPYHPQSSGKLEVFHKYLKPMLKKLCVKDPCKLGQILKPGTRQLQNYT